MKHIECQQPIHYNEFENEFRCTGFIRR
jgi:hypothetical protein